MSHGLIQPNITEKEEEMIGTGFLSERCWVWCISFLKSGTPIEPLHGVTWASSFSIMLWLCLSLRQTCWNIAGSFLHEIEKSTSHLIPGNEQWQLHHFFLSQFLANDLSFRGKPFINLFLPGYLVVFMQLLLQWNIYCPVCLIHLLRLPHIAINSDKQRYNGVSGVRTRLEKCTRSLMDAP